MPLEDESANVLVAQILSAGREAPTQPDTPVPTPLARGETKVDKLVAEIMNAGR